MSNPEDRVVELRQERSGRNTRALTVRTSRGGGIVIEGLDTGPAVESHFGSSDYEWAIVIAAEDVDAYVSALGGQPGDDDPLDLLEARYPGDPRCVMKTFLDEHGIPCRLWSWNSG